MKVYRKVLFHCYKPIRWLWVIAALSSSSIFFNAQAATAHSPTELKGEMQQGALIRGTTKPGTTVLLDGKNILVTPKGYFVFGFGRDAKEEHELVFKYPDGTQEVRSIKIAQRKYNIQKVTGIAKKIMSPSKKSIERAKKDSRMIKAARKKISKDDGFMDDFQWPAVGPITGVYGSQRFYNGKPSRPHYGVDVANPTGSPVTAPAKGLVTLAVPDMFYSGGTVIIDHGYGVNSTFLHMSKITVKVGQSVKTGDKIGEIGATGRVTGPHLDWRMNWFNQRLDPQLVVPPMPK